MYLPSDGNARARVSGANGRNGGHPTIDASRILPKSVTAADQSAHPDDSTCSFPGRPRYNCAMPVRFIALDIDGTLLDSASALPEANRVAIEAAFERGIEVALVTLSLIHI